jgi:hypothetical protein
MEKKRGEKGGAMKMQAVETPAIWGTLYPPDPRKWAGKVALMEHPGKGQRYVLNGDVEKKEKQGWKRVVVIDPTKPVDVPQAPQHRGGKK